MMKGGKKVSLLPVRRGDTNNNKSNLTAKSRLTDPVAVTQFSQNCISQTGYKDNCNDRRARFHVAGVLQQCKDKEVSAKERLQQGHVSGGPRRCVDVLAKRHSKEKSLFREIKKRYAESRGPAPPINDDFCSLIVRRVRTTANLGCIPQGLRQTIQTEIRIVNDILAGKLDPASDDPSSVFYNNPQYNACHLPQQDSNRTNMSNCKRPHIEATVPAATTATTKDEPIVNKQKKPTTHTTVTSKHNKENAAPSFKFPYIPESSWIFQTPPNRKLNFDHIKTAAQCREKDGIQPAVLQAGRERTVVYEMNKKINVDLSNFDGKKGVNIDRRVMMQVASVSHQQQPAAVLTGAAAATATTVMSEEVVIERCKEKRFVYHQQEVEMMQTSPAKFQFQTDPYELENHFLNLTCRPKKVSNSIPRAVGLKRKRDIFEIDHQCGEDGDSGRPVIGGNNAICGGGDEFDSDFGFLNNATSPREDCLTYEYTGGGPDGDGPTITGYLFDFDGNKKDSFDFPLGNNE